MIRSLYSGISGLRTHQVGLDVTANNIANVNTVAFKAGRATFKESMAQMLEGASRPAGNAGGRNPMQVGLGVAVGSIDTMLRQGGFQTTGQITDLALEGRAYFAFSSGGGSMFYSRHGGLQMDAEGRLVSPTNGLRLQGRMADVNGEYGATSLIGDIRIPWGDKSPAKATDIMSFSCNLHNDSHALGTVTHTNRFLANANAALGSDMHTRGKLTDLFNENGQSLGIKEGDVLTFKLADPNFGTFSFPVAKYDIFVWEDSSNNVHRSVVSPLDPAYPGTPPLPIDINGLRQEQQIPTLDDLAAALEGFLQDAYGTTDISVDIDAQGRFRITNGHNENINGLQMSSSRPISTAFVAQAFLFPPTIDAAAGTPLTPGIATTPPFRIPAAATDEIRNLFEQSGHELGLTDGDQLKISGMVGGKNKDFVFTFYDGVGAASAAAGRVTPSSPTTMQEMMDFLTLSLGLPSTDGTIYNRPSVTMKDSSDLVNDGIPLGSIVLRGQPEVAFALTGISVIGKQGNPNQLESPNRFNSNMIFTTSQHARNTEIHPTSAVVFDDSGAQHTVFTQFIPTNTPGEWLWEMTTLGSDAVILGGNRGRITFAIDGTPSSFTFDDGSNSFRFDPRNGASEVDISLNVGTPGSRLGITQFESPSGTSTTAASANGHGMGKLAEIQINSQGEIMGMYDNNISKSIAQIWVAEFNNPAGLLKMGDTMFAVSNNSGEATMYQPGVGSTTKVMPGTLEMSNVELETEFTNMITIQRGYQASARTISTSDQMLQELIQLVR